MTFDSNDHDYDEPHRRKNKSYAQRDLPPNLTKVIVALIGLLATTAITFTIIIVLVPQLNIVFGGNVEQPEQQPTIVSMVTDMPDIHPTAVTTQRTIWQERQELQAYEYDTFTRTLADDEIIVGDAVDVEDRGLFCVVFWVKGPRTITFSMLNGAWDRYSGVVMQEQIDEQVQDRHNHLQNIHTHCRTRDVPIIELGT